MEISSLCKTWALGQKVIRKLLSVRNCFVADVLSAQCHGVLTLDLQQGTIDYVNSVRLYEAALDTKVVTLARIEWLDPFAILKALDAGAHGIICPMVNTARDAARLVSLTRDATGSVRRFIIDRAALLSASKYGSQAEEEPLIFVIIETAAAFENLAAIAATPGLDGIYIGPSDLNLSLTDRQPDAGFDRGTPDLAAAMTKVLAVAHKAGIYAALHCHSAGEARHAREKGFDLVIVSEEAQRINGPAVQVFSVRRNNLEALACGLC